MRMFVGNRQSKGVIETILVIVPQWIPDQVRDDHWFKQGGKKAKQHGNLPT